MSAHTIISLLSVVLAVFAVAIAWLISELVSAKKDLASEKLAHADTTHSLDRTNARFNELRKVGSEMYMEFQATADNAAYQLKIVAFLEKRIADLISHAATMNAKRFAEEKKAVGASILEFLFAVFFPASCGRRSTV